MRTLAILSLIANGFLFFAYQHFYKDAAPPQSLNDFTKTFDATTKLVDESIQNYYVPNYYRRKSREAGNQRIFWAYNAIDSIANATIRDVETGNVVIDSIQSNVTAAMFDVYNQFLNDSIKNMYYYRYEREEEYIIKDLSQKMNKLSFAASTIKDKNLLVAQTNLNIKQRQFLFSKEILQTFYQNESCGFSKLYPILLQTIPDFAESNKNLQILFGIQVDVNDDCLDWHDNFKLTVNQQKTTTVFKDFYYKYSTKANKIGLQSLDIHLDYEKNGTKQSLEQTLSYLVQ